MRANLAETIGLLDARCEADRPMTDAELRPFEDPGHEGNGAKYLTGKPCIDCGNPAGTAWSPHWCFECNVKRIKRINAGLQACIDELSRMKQMDAELKPCLRCGSKSISSLICISSWKVIIGCTKCGFRGPGARDYDGAASLWNTRVKDESR